jgi:hypothetical protein
MTNRLITTENTEKTRRSQSENIKESSVMLFEHFGNNKRGFGEMKTERIQQEQKYLQRR